MKFCSFSFAIFIVFLFVLWIVFPRKNPSCPCRRRLEGHFTSLCSGQASFRGTHQYVISISLFGPRENPVFQWDQSFVLLRQFLAEMKEIYPQWILRVYHDQTIPKDRICRIECEYPQVDFCNANALMELGDIAAYVPGKIWRFLPIGDPSVDVMLSRDLDSPLTRREFQAVDQWLQSNRSWHVMRDHPNHVAPMMGGMWGFRAMSNRTFAEEILQKILSRHRMRFYPNRGDQQFLRDHVWRYIRDDDVLIHDSFLCQSSFGRRTDPWPTPRPSPGKDSGCFVGCVRPCCPNGTYPFQACPLACRPSAHPDWTFC